MYVSIYLFICRHIYVCVYRCIYISDKPDSPHAAPLSTLGTMSGNARHTQTQARVVDCKIPRKENSPIF